MIYWSIPDSPQHQKFNKEMENRRKAALKKTESSEEVCTKKEIDALPTALRSYCQYIRLEGSRKENVIHTLFKDTKFVFDESSGKILNMDYDLWIFLDRPYREAFCSASMYGIPFDGIDYYVEGTDDGGMKGYLGKSIHSIQWG